jgi:hypothetical protein
VATGKAEMQGRTRQHRWSATYEGSLQRRLTPRIEEEGARREYDSAGRELRSRPAQYIGRVDLASATCRGRR